MKTEKTNKQTDNITKEFNYWYKVRVRHTEEQSDRQTDKTERILSKSQTASGGNTLLLRYQMFILGAREYTPQQRLQLCWPCFTPATRVKACKCWLVGWLVCLLVVWLVSWLVACLLACLVPWLLGWMIGCLTSKQHACASQGRIFRDTEIEAAVQTCFLTQSQHTDAGPTSPSTDPVTPGARAEQPLGKPFCSTLF